MIIRLLRLVTLLGTLSLLWSAPSSAAPAAGADVQSLLHTLDYLSVDYPPIIVNGVVTDANEYAEQREFAGRARTLMAQLPDTAQKAQLVGSVQHLVDLIEHHAPGPEVQSLCRTLVAAVVAAYQVKIAPPSAPSLQTGAALFASHCAQCHGADGFGDGPRAAGLDPKPVNFHDRSRQDQRSIYSLYNTISLGVEGTPMRAFTELDSMQRWALAFYVSNFLASDEERARGEALWQAPQYHGTFTDLAAVTQALPANYNADQAAVLAYLRSHPEKLARTLPKPLDIARQKLGDSVSAYAAGHHRQAYDAAVSAYLEGFELVEAPLMAVNNDLKLTVEQAMGRYRQAVKDGTAGQDEIVRQEQAILAMLDQAEEALHSGSLSPGMAFTSAFIILLREGMEAILVLAAIMTFLIKADRRDALPQVHMGWIAALIAGALTWYAAKELLTFSSVNRELMEGYTALFSAAMLLYVGYWLHNHSHAQRWKSFIHGRIQGNVGTGAVWGLVLISFVAVYREVAETILFYETLWLQSSNADYGYLLGGLISGAVVLLGIAWLIFRLGVRLPLKLFFRANATLLTVLAVVFAGHGIAALQEAGKLRVDPVSFPEIQVLGIYPTLESLGVQLILVTACITWLLYSRSRGQE
jgi:high-affinity iron transporter